MNFVPSWRNGTPFLKRGRRRRRRLKTQVYVVLLIGGFLIVSHVYQNQQWNDFRNFYWAQEELLVYDGGGGGLRNKNGNLGSSVGTNQQPPESATPNPHAKWNPKIVSTTRDVQLAEKPMAATDTGHATDSTNNKKAASFLRDSRQSNHFSDFVQMDTDHKEDTNEMTYDQAKKGREPLLEIFHDLGLAPLTIDELLQVPKWTQIEDLYGDRPQIVGMDTCLQYQMKVPIAERYIGVAGSFNTGTTAFGLSLQQNCRFPNRSSGKTEGAINKPAGKVVTNVHGMLNQVPWAKHKMAHERFDHTIDETIPKENVLPVVLVRDPYFWMQSMCLQGYGVRWDHNNKKHCPNLVPNEFDKKRFKKYAKNATSVPVWMGQSYDTGPHWDSLVHYWNDWYGSYYHNDMPKQTNATDGGKKETFPRLIIRFEDTLFHAKTVMKMVCACGGGIFSGNEDEEDDDEEEEVNIGFSTNNAKATKGGSFRPILDEAKFEHRHSQNNLVSAIVKYGTDKMRYRNMTSDDLEFAQTHLDPELIQAFQYKVKER